MKMKCMKCGSCEEVSFYVINYDDEKYYEYHCLDCAVYMIETLGLWIKPCNDMIKYNTPSKIEKFQKSILDGNIVSFLNK